MEFRKLLLPHNNVQYIGGLPVLINNAFYGKNNGAANDVIFNRNYFITGFFDLSGSGSKYYTFNYILKPERYDTFIRIFDDKNGTSVNYLTNSSASSENDRTVLINGGRFIAVSIYKPEARDSFLLCNTDNVYLFRGKDI